MNDWVQALPPDAKPPAGLIGGPILRRAAADEVAVWVATAGPVTVDGRVFVAPDDGSAPTVLGQSRASSLAFGAHLHVTLVVITPSVDTFPTGQLLHYDLTFTVADAGGDRSFGLAQYRPTAPAPGAAPFSYPKQRWPGFHLTGELPTRLWHGSCRKFHEGGDDAMAIADDLLQAATTDGDLRLRPAGLLLTGDQIYADDIADILANPLLDLARWLTGIDESLPLAGPLSTRYRSSWVRHFARVFRPDGGADPLESVARHHAAGFGEYAALYLLAFNDALWPNFQAMDSLAFKAASPAGQLQALTEFRAALPKVRRALANVPTYMILDDHEVTDDWNLDREIHDSAMDDAFGRRVVANALAAYLVFQGWGNDPTGTTALVEQVQQALISGGGDALEGALFTVPSWSYVTPTQPAVVVLDTRTTRDFSQRGRVVAGLLNSDALYRLGTDLSAVANDGQPVVLVSAAPVFGIDAVEDLQLRAGWSQRYHRDREFWAANPDSFRSFLDALLDTVNGRLVILSGDLHYGFVRKVWLERAADGKSLDIVQFTSSAVRNSAPSAFIDHIVSPLAAQTTFRSTVRTPGGAVITTNAAWAARHGAVLQTITSSAVAPARSGANPVVADHNIGEVVFDSTLTCLLYTPDRGASRPLEMPIDPFGTKPTRADAVLLGRSASAATVDAPGPLLAQAGPGIPPMTPPTPGNLNSDDKLVVAAVRLIRNDARLRQLADGMPLEFLAGWIEVESGGRFDHVESTGETGYFQIHRDDMPLLGATTQQIIATPRSSLWFGLRLVGIAVRQVDRWTTDFGLTPDSDTRLRLVKLYHTVGAGSFAALLKAYAAAAGDGSGTTLLIWGELTRFWRRHPNTITAAPKARRILRQYDRMIRNVDEVMTRSARLAPYVSADTVP